MIDMDELVSLGNTLKSRSTETYFGINAPLTVDLIACFTNLRNRFSDAGGTTRDDLKNILPKLKNDIRAIELAIERHLNVERCAIGFIEEENASSLAFFIDKNLAKDLKAPKKLNTEYIIDLNSFIETSSGFKFKNNKNKIIILELGVQLLYGNKYTVEETAALTLHEIGHAFQHMLMGVNNDILYRLAQVEIQMYYDAFKKSKNTIQLLTLAILPTATLGVANKNENVSKLSSAILVAEAFFLVACLLNGVADNKITYIKKYIDDLRKGKLSDEDVTNLTKALIKGMDRPDRTDIVSKIDEDQVEALVRMINTSKPKRFFINAAIFVWNSLKFLLLPFTIPSKILAKIFVKDPSKKLAQELADLKRYEEFADAFATFYGLGTQVSTALIKMYKGSQRPGFRQIGIFNILHNVPLINFAINYSTFQKWRTEQLIAGYPETTELRLANSYAQLKYEYENNKDLSDEMKKEIQHQMDDAKETYQQIVYGDKTAKELAYVAFKKSKGEKSIETEKVDVVKNVLEVLNERRNIIEAEIQETVSNSSKIKTDLSPIIEKASKEI